jgi:hypothetical protein
LEEVMNKENLAFNERIDKIVNVHLHLEDEIGPDE